MADFKIDLKFGAKVSWSQIQYQDIPVVNGIAISLLSGGQSG